jgi:serine/threonine-protein kinase
MLLGTAAYLAPEQAQGIPLDARCDVYALACVAYHRLTGSTPYPEGPLDTVAAAHVHSPVPELTGVPADVAAVVRRGLAKEPSQRWPSAGSFATALSAATGSTTSRPVEATILQRGAETAVQPVVPTRRTGRLVSVLALVLALGAAGIAAALLTREDTRPTPTTPDRHAALIASLRAAIYTACAAATPPKEAVVTAVTCRPTQPGASSLLVRKWSSPAAMNEDFAATYAKHYPDGKCSRQTGVRSTWAKGRLACYVNVNGDAVLMYSYDAQGLQVLAVRSDGNSRALYAWWDAQAIG